MTSITKDPLLAIAKGITWFCIGIFGFAAGVIAIVSPFVFLKKGEIVAEMAAKGVDVGLGFVFAIFIAMLLIAGLLVLAIWFFRLLQKIIDSVGEGDPFIPENAARLARMAWIALGGQLASIPLGAGIAWIAKLAADAGEHVNADVGIGGGGIMLVLVLFILARVFRKGTEMRAELEGTV